MPASALEISQPLLFVINRSLYDIYNNHLHGPITNARLKKYLIEDSDEPGVTDLETAKQYIKEHCYVQFKVINNLLERGQVEGLLSFLLDV